MKRLSTILFTVVSVAYPFIVLGGLVFFKASPRVLAFCLLAILVLNFLANAKDIRTKGFTRNRFWLVSGILTILVVVIFLTDNPTLVKVYPVVMNLFFLSSFGFTLWKGPNMIFRFACLQDKTIVDSPDRATVEAYCRKVTLIWCALFVFNTIMSLITAFWAPDWFWTLYNGAISYVLIGLLFGGEFLFRKLVIKI